MPNSVRKSAAVLLVFGLGLLLWNVAANGHFHVLPDGTIRFHCHPYQNPFKKSPNDYPAHHHTNFAFAFYSLLTHLGFATGVIAVVYLFLLVARPFSPGQGDSLRDRFSFSPRVARAPPLCRPVGGVVSP